MSPIKLKVPKWVLVYPSTLTLAGKGISSSWKWWQTILKIKNSCNQWEGSACTLGGPKKVFWGVFIVHKLPGNTKMRTCRRTRQHYQWPQADYHLIIVCYEVAFKLFFWKRDSYKLWPLMATNIKNFKFFKFLFLENGWALGGY